MNAAQNGLKNISFEAEDAAVFMRELAEEAEVQDAGAADVLFMDPPRSGATEAFLKAVQRLAPKKIVYISCDPVTLSRDLDYLTQNGYCMKRAVPVDMFPYTQHIETVCLLSQRKPDTTIEVDLDISELEVSSAETKATYEEIKSYVLKKYGLKVSNLYIAQVKRECGIVERKENAELWRGSIIIFRRRRGTEFLSVRRIREKPSKMRSYIFR